MTTPGDFAAVPDLDGPSLAILLDNARTALVTAVAAGLEPGAFLISQRDFDALRETKWREVRSGLPARIFGLDVYPGAGIDMGAVQLASTDESPDR